MDWSDVLNFDQAGLSHRKIEDNIFALHNSSRPTQPHLVVANDDNDHFVDQRLHFKLLFFTFGNVPFEFYSGTQTREFETI